ncbi:MAG: hypothetical protein ABIN80_19950 [Dyadobacter sp.]|uniref:hypothetical protein n=1 Tax=Dyadobacter sp. TaxID=1914288 RepID=UPI003263BBF4
MKRKHTIGYLLTFIINSSAAFAQVSEGTKVGINSGRGLNALKSDVFWTSPTDMPNVIGEFYIDSVWQEGKVKFTSIVPQLGGWNSDSLTGIQIRYNTLNDELEVLADKSKNDIRVIKGGQLKNFTTNLGTNPKMYVNVATFKSEKPLRGFAKVLVQGDLSLIEYFYPKITKPNYNPGFATGEKNTVVRQGSDYYVVSKGTAEKATLSKKSMLAFMNEKQKDVEAYLKEKNVNFKNEDDVVRLFKFYNGLK